MWAFLFDRRSLLVTAIAMAGIGILLFVAGFLVGASVGWQRHLAELDRLASFPLPTAAHPAPAAPPRPEPGEASPAAAPASGKPPTDWVPFSPAAPWPDEPAATPTPAPDSTPAPAAPNSGSARAEPPAPAAAPPPEPTARPAVTSSGYFVQLAAFANTHYAREERTQVAARLEGRTYGPYLAPTWDRAGRQLLALRIGPFSTRREAEAAAAGFSGAWVRKGSGRGSS